jgi:hypothetical protein
VEGKNTTKGKKMKHALLRAVSAGVLVSVMASPVFAQEQEETKSSTGSESGSVRIAKPRTVTNDYDIYTNAVANVRDYEAMSAYAPLGARVPGQFLFHPTVGVKERYQSNIFRTDNNEESDFITSVQPGFLLKSDWAVHALDITALGDLGYYADNTSENYQDYRLGAKGRFDIMHDTYFTGKLTHDHLHENRGSPNNLGGADPTEFDRTVIGAGFTRELGLLKLYADVDNEEWSYDENSSLPGQRDRDRSQQNYKAKLAYELSPDYEAYVSYAFRDRQFDSNTSGVSADSKAHEIIAGTDIYLTGTMRADIYGGYTRQTYDQSNIDTLDFINYGGSLNWSLTPITSLQADVYRDVRPSITGTTTDYVETSFGAQLAHALRDNWIADARLRYVNDEFFDTTGANVREDDVYLAGLGMDYLLDRGLAVRGTYDLFTRDSDQVGQDFVDHTVGVSLNYMY